MDGVPATSQMYTAGLAKQEFYPLWSSVPEPGDTIDPFDYRQRMAVYKLLIEATNQNGIFGAENEYNLFWGYLFQLNWQWRSGRLQLAATPPGRIDANSVWGYGNYALSVIPLIAAMQTGLLPEKEILGAPSESAFDYATGGGKSGLLHIPPVFDEAVQRWEALFQLMQRYKPGDDLEGLRFELWGAHHRSLLAAEDSLDSIGPRFCSRNELDFLIGWIRMVDFLGSAAWRTDLPFMLDNGVGMLPERLIRDEDRPGHIGDMNSQINVNVRSIISLTRQSRLRFQFNLWLWKRAMRTRQARDEVLPMLDATFNPSPQNIDERRKLLRYMLALSG
jgi:hypothetical protein